MTGVAFTLGSWHDITTYKCTLCLFDCMDELQAREHYAEHFRVPMAEATGEPASLIVDGAGTIASISTAAAQAVAPADASLWLLMDTE